MTKCALLFSTRRSESAEVVRIDSGGYGLPMRSCFHGGVSASFQPCDIHFGAFLFGDGLDSVNCAVGTSCRTLEAEVLRMIKVGNSNLRASVVKATNKLLVTHIGITTHVLLHEYASVLAVNDDTTYAKPLDRDRKKTTGLSIVKVQEWFVLVHLVALQPLATEIHLHLLRNQIHQSMALKVLPDRLE